MLFIVLGFELRVFGRLDAPAESDLLLASARLWAFLIIAWGEWRAFHFLTLGHGSAGAQSDVTTALIAEGVVLALIPVAAFARALHEGVPKRFQSQVTLIRRGVQVLAGLDHMAWVARCRVDLPG